MRPTPLPLPLADRSFTTGEALDLLVPAQRLRAKDLVAPYHGVRRPAGPAPVDLRGRCEEFAPRLRPGQFFSHSTALGLHGAPLRAVRTAGELHVGAQPPRREPRTPGVSGHRIRLLAGEASLLDGLPTAPAAEAWAQAGALLGTDELIVAAEGMLRLGAVTVDALRAAAEGIRRRGAVDLRDALAQIRLGSESPQETRTRLLLVRAGLPEPELNWTLRTGSGRFVARLDLAYPAYRVAVEYDGRQHAEHAQFARDADRWAAIEAEGWALIRVLSHHLARPRTLTARVRHQLSARGWTPGAVR